MLFQKKNNDLIEEITDFNPDEVHGLYASKKGAIIFLADFKGGVDYPTVWHQYCNIITEQSELDSQLTQILDEMERRRSLIVSSQTSNIGGKQTVHDCTARAGIRNSPCPVDTTP